jgi:hypothetical protein
MNKYDLLIFYKKFIRKASEIKYYNFKEHSIRRIRHEFKSNTKLDKNYLQTKYDQLERIVIVQNLYYKPVLI